MQIVFNEMTTLFSEKNVINLSSAELTQSAKANF